MPTYVYACRNCDARTEVRQRISDEPLKVCTECQGELRRVLFAPAVVYKGAGFYTTDYKNGGSRTPGDEAPKTEESAKPTPGESTRSEATPAESKPATPAAGDSAPPKSTTADSASSPTK